MRKNNRKGFTIVELVIVIAVIAILAAVLIPTFAGIISKANKSTIDQETRAALTTILSEENAQMSSDADYYFLYVEEDAVTYFEYVNGELEEREEVEALEKLNANDIVWYADVEVFKNAGLDSETDDAAGIRTLHADLGDNIVVVKKVVSETTNAGLEAAEAAHTADITEFNKLTDKASKKAGDVIGEVDSAYTLKGSIDYVAADSSYTYTYTYIADGYTYEYSSTTEKWTITKN